MTSNSAPATRQETVEEVVIRFAGDSGDGMQLTGNQFSNTSAIVGNDLATFPDFPAEIRAPAGTLPGVSSFQVRFSSFDIHNPGDSPDVLVAMNPAALRVNVTDLKANALIIVNVGNFGKMDLKKANYDYNPLESHDLDGFRVIQVDLNKLTQEALNELDLDPKSRLRCKNFFALGMMYWIFNRPVEPTLKWLHDKFKNKPKLVEANCTAVKAGFNYADITAVFQVQYDVPKAKLEPGIYRNIMGSQALGMGLAAAATLSKRPMFLGSYPITPASDILHQLSRYKHLGIMTFQAEDEISAVCAAIGAAFAGNLAITATSGPGLALKGEAIGLAVMTELPLVIIDVQRAGPSTGMPTKTEQSDLMQAMYGRNGESPVCVISASTPSDCFDTVLTACRIAVKYMVPVIMLTDGYLANGAEPWKLPRVEELPPFEVEYRTQPEGFEPYLRDPKTLARPWAIPGTPGLEHRIGGLEKADNTGNVCYDPQNHEFMSHTRADKVARIAADIPPLEVKGDRQGKLLIVSWGGTYGSLAGAMRRSTGGVAWIHLRHLNPFAPNLGEILDSFEKVVVPELNMGQLVRIIRDTFGIDAIPFNKIQGRPFTQDELAAMITKHLE